MMLADARHIVAADASTRAGKWEKKQFMGRELAGKTVGIVGLGNIGRLVARRLSGFRCARCSGYDPVISARTGARDGRRADRPGRRCSRESDYITLHIPENDETRGMVERRAAGHDEGRRHASSTAPGPASSTKTPCAPRKADKGMRFLNDVYPKDAEGEKSVADIADIMLPHLGASTVEANYNAARRAAEQLIDLDEKGITSFIVNRDIPEGLDEAYCELANTLARLCRCLVGRDTPAEADRDQLLRRRWSPIADWLLVPIVAGHLGGLRPVHGLPGRARSYLEEMGIDYVEPRRRRRARATRTPSRST